MLENLVQACKHQNLSQSPYASCQAVKACVPAMYGRFSFAVPGLAEKGPYGHISLLCCIHLKGQTLSVLAGQHGYELTFNLTYKCGMLVCSHLHRLRFVSALLHLEQPARSCCMLHQLTGLEFGTNAHDSVILYRPT